MNEIIQNRNNMSYNEIITCSNINVHNTMLFLNVTGMYLLLCVINFLEEKKNM